MSDRLTQALVRPEKIADLLAAHKADVEDVLKRAREYVAANPAVKEAADDAPLDELYALRFVLSAKREDPKLAYDNLVKTLEWRAKNFQQLKDSHEGKIAHQEWVVDYLKIAVLGLLGDLHPTFVVRAGRGNPKQMFSTYPMEDFVQHLMLLNERMHHMCDKKTRETGYLCKQVLILDIEGFSLFQWDSRAGKSFVKASALSAIYYPQLRAKTVIMNLPMTFRLIYRAIKSVAPASATEKHAVCPANTLKRSASECPFLRKFTNGPSLMPPFLGGYAPMLPELELDFKH